jgi:hypothetical protein
MREYLTLVFLTMAALAQLWLLVRLREINRDYDALIADYRALLANYEAMEAFLKARAESECRTISIAPDDELPPRKTRH